MIDTCLPTPLQHTYLSILKHFKNVTGYLYFRCDKKRAQSNGGEYESTPLCNIF